VRALLLVFAAGCATTAQDRLAGGELSARPAAGHQPLSPGVHPLQLGAKRDGVLFVPVHLATPAPLLVLLHGAGGSGARIAAAFAPLAEKFGVVLLAPDSRDVTWDLVRGGWGPDVAFLDQALAQLFAHHAIDKKKLAIGGFSDGASQALTLGLVNGLLFTHILAFSQAAAPPPSHAGWPRVFVAHGNADRVLPVDGSRQWAARLRRAGYDVSYREFDGAHHLDATVAEEALRWWLER
jgi:phospholipase/carboxylesterase